MKLWHLFWIALALAIVGWASSRVEAASPVAVCGLSGTSGQSNCIIPNSDGSIPTSPVSGTTGDVNLKQVGGVATKTGAGTAAGVQRVELPTDGTGKVGLNAGSAVIGKVGIDQTTPGTTNAVEIGPYSYSRKTADGQVKATAGFVHTICLAPTTATPTAGLVTLYDSAAESGTIVFSSWFFATTNAECATLDVTMGTGIFVGYDATVTNMSVTVSYR